MYLLCIQNLNSGFRTCDIVFSKRVNLFRWVCLFCNFVRNTIYVLAIEIIGLVVLARKHKSGNARILMLDCMISQVSRGF